MNTVDRYVSAAVRDNTRRSYQSAIRHFEVEWGGLLPATSDAVAAYLAAHAEQLAVSTLKQRLAALGQWHRSQGFPDPTKSPLVRQVLKGIRAVHPQRPKQATPLAIEVLQDVCEQLEFVRLNGGSRADRLRAARDRALLLLGFWRGFRGDELARLDCQGIRLLPGQGMEIHLAYQKGDRNNLGRYHRVPALKQLCPVTACAQWFEDSGITEGAVFRGIDRWGHLSPQPLQANSISGILRRAIALSGRSAELYSSHSLRRGFATWAASSGWDLKALMDYVGWKDMKSALRYVEAPGSFGALAISDSFRIGSDPA